jgi:hypothetical protein
VDNWPSDVGLKAGYPQFKTDVLFSARGRYDWRMKVRVFVLRESGRRTEDRAGEGIVGELRLHSTMQGHAVINVATVSSTMHMGSKQADALPSLYEPQLIALGTNAMPLRGFESSAGVGYVQEWRCEIE